MTAETILNVKLTCSQVALMKTLWIKGFLCLTTFCTTFENFPSANPNYFKFNEMSKDKYIKTLSNIYL